MSGHTEWVRHSLKWLRTFKRPEGILARWIETLAEFDFEIEHRAGRLHSNADAISRQNCKQCWGKVASDNWIDECERADQLVEPLSLHTIQLRSEFSDDAIAELQAEDTEIGKAYEVMSENLDPSTDEFRALPLESRRLLSMQPEVRIQDNLMVKERDGKVQVVVPVVLRKRQRSTSRVSSYLPTAEHILLLVWDAPGHHPLVPTMSTLCQGQRTTTSSTWSTAEDTSWCSNGSGHNGHTFRLTNS